jgi:hypothetical protein
VPLGVEVGYLIGRLQPIVSKLNIPAQRLIAHYDTPQGRAVRVFRYDGDGSGLDIVWSGVLSESTQRERPNPHLLMAELVGNGRADLILFYDAPQQRLQHFHMYRYVDDQRGFVSVVADPIDAPADAQATYLVADIDGDRRGELVQVRFNDAQGQLEVRAFRWDDGGGAFFRIPEADLHLPAARPCVAAFAGGRDLFTREERPVIGVASGAATENAGVILLDPVRA